MYPAIGHVCFLLKSRHCSPGLKNQEKRIAKSKLLKWARELSHKYAKTMAYTKVRVFKGL